MTLPRILSAAGRALAVLGAVLLLFVAFELWGTGLQQAQAQNSLEGDFAERFRRAAAAGQGASSAGTGSGDPDPAAPVTDPATGEAAAGPSASGGGTDAPAPAAGGATDNGATSASGGTAATEGDGAAAPPAPASLPEYRDLPHVVRHIDEAAGARSVDRLLDPEVEALLPLVYPEDGEAIARIVIPAIDVDAIVVAGVGTEDLRKGPGHYGTTPLPGQPGNAAIAGHRTTYGAPFGRLNELIPGDEIIVETLQGGFVYEVLAGGRGMAGQTPGYRIVLPTTLEVLDDHGDNRLTLTSCHPKYSSRQRIIVHAALVGDPVVRLPRPGEPIGAAFVQLAGAEDPPAAGDDADRRDGAEEVAAGGGPDQDGSGGAAADGSATPADDSGEAGPVAAAGSQRAATAAAEIPAPANPIPEDGFGEGLSGDRDAILPAVLWGLAAAAILAVGRRAGRTGRRLRAYAVTAAPFLAVLYVLFSYVDRALPAY